MAVAGEQRIEHMMVDRTPRRASNVEEGFCPFERQQVAGGAEMLRPQPADPDRADPACRIEIDIDGKVQRLQLHGMKAGRQRVHLGQKLGKPTGDAHVVLEDQRQRDRLIHHALPDRRMAHETADFAGCPAVARSIE